ERAVAVEVVVDAAAVVQELANRDPVDVRDAGDDGIGEPLTDGVVESQDTVVDQLQDEHGGEGFGDACDAGAVVRLEQGLLFKTGDPGGAIEDDFITAFDAEGNARETEVETGLEDLLERRGWCSRGRCRGSGGPG